jgi:hypothetical protein
MLLHTVGIEPTTVNVLGPLFCIRQCQKTKKCLMMFLLLTELHHAHKQACSAT